MKDYTVIVTEIKTVELTATAPSAKTALDMVRTLKRKTTVIDNAPNAETETIYRVFENEQAEDDEDTTPDVPPCFNTCPNCPFSAEYDDEGDEENLIDEIC